MFHQYCVYEVGYVSRTEKDATASVSADSRSRVDDLLKDYLARNGDALVEIKSRIKTPKTSAIEGVTYDSGHHLDDGCVLEGFFSLP